MLIIIVEITRALNLWLVILYIKLFLHVGTKILSQEILTQQTLLFFDLFFACAIITMVVLLMFYLEIKKIKDFFVNTHIIKELQKSKDHFYDHFFAFFVSRYENKCVKMTYFFLQYPNLHSIFYLCFMFIPLIILFFLLTEIHFKQFYYYYNALLLLFILIISNLIIYLLQHVGPKLFPKYKKKTQIVIGEYFSFRNIYEKETAIHHNLRLEFKKQYNTENFPYFYVYYYKPMETIFIFMKDYFLPRYNKTKLFILLIYFFIQTLCWGYIYFFLC